MPEKEALEAAVARAIGFLASTREPQALIWLAQIHRRFGIQEFASALQRFDELLAGQPAEAPKLRLLRRIAEPGNPLDPGDLEGVTHTSDRIIVAALYSDQLEPPSFYPDVLGQALRQGGYYCTHALLAWVWLQEYGGQVELPADFAADLFAATAAIVNQDPSSVTDLKLEAAAFLFLAGQGARVDRGFVRAVTRTQNADGGWGMTRASPGVSDWHGTVLGLLLLLQVLSEPGLEASRET
ncbi:MAG TPA: hypothetical protein VIV64_09480 [Gammaproteobacteria bacterium]